MIESFGWLLLSDLHLKAGADPWAQHVVLREMRDDIRQRKLDPSPRFVLVSGDLAHGGSDDEYKQVETVFDSFRSELGLRRTDFFLVPGNHDINRAVQKLCFAGARHQLKDANAVDSFLGDPEEKASLLQRLSAYREFVDRYCVGQTRNVVDGDLGFVAPIDIAGFPISIVGLNSAWLCGGEDDNRNILVGERTVIDVLSMLDQLSSRLVLGIFHHPPEWLQDFDRFALEQRMYLRCNIIHRGHLHEPGVRQVALLPGQACLMVAAGASYAGRQFRNSYAHIVIDLSRSICRVTTVIHEAGTFVQLPPVEFPVVLRGQLADSATALAADIAVVSPIAAPFQNYLASLLLGSTAELPVRIDGRALFVAESVLGQSEDLDLAEAGKRYLELRNLLLAFRDNTPLRTRLEELHMRINQFAGKLVMLVNEDQDFAVDIQGRESAARRLSNAARPAPYANTLALFDGLVADSDWDGLEQTARRFVNVPDKDVALRAMRMLALGLSKRDEPSATMEATGVMQQLINDGDGAPADYVIAATLLHNDGQDDAAKRLLIEYAGKFPDNLGAAIDIGMAVVLATGDTELVAALGLPQRGGK